MIARLKLWTAGALVFLFGLLALLRRARKQGASETVAKAKEADHARATHVETRADAARAADAADRNPAADRLHTAGRLRD